MLSRSTEILKTQRRSPDFFVSVFLCRMIHLKTCVCVGLHFEIFETVNHWFVFGLVLRDTNLQICVGKTCETWLWGRVQVDGLRVVWSPSESTSRLHHRAFYEELRSERDRCAVFQECGPPASQSVHESLCARSFDYDYDLQICLGFYKNTT